MVRLFMLVANDVSVDQAAVAVGEYMLSFIEYLIPVSGYLIKG